MANKKLNSFSKLIKYRERKKRLKEAINNARLASSAKHLSDVHKTLPAETVLDDSIAIVVNGVVEDVIHCQRRLADMLLSNPVFVSVKDKNPVPTIGWIYNEELNDFFMRFEIDVNAEIKEEHDH
jgi:hypothetical protein